MDTSLKTLSEITVYNKYARFLPKEERRETWQEIVIRNQNMHIKKYPFLKDEIIETYKFVLNKQVLPSMRALQFSGKPIEISPNRQYNCCYLPIDNWEAFHEIMFLLLGGTGVGYSIQQHHIDNLPDMKKRPNRTRRHLVGDSIEGWADAVKVLVKSYFFGLPKPNFDFSDIRERGALLVTSGGKAPGPQPLKDCIHNLEKIFDAKQIGEQLTSIEVHDIVCFIADAVLAGGIRRAALIALFSFHDQDMLTCKFGNWFERNPQRGRANNSAVILRHKINKKDFLGLWEKIQASQSGEPGIFFSNDKEWGCNPSLRAGTKVLTSGGIFPIEDLEDQHFKVPNLNGSLSQARCWMSSPSAPLYRLKLQGGHEYYATAEHEWPVVSEDGTIVKKTTLDLQNQDTIPVCLKNSLFDGEVGNYEDGFVLGWQAGDGWLTQRSDNQKIQHGFIVSHLDDQSIKVRIENYLERLGSQAKFGSRGELNTSHPELSKNLEQFGGGHKSNGLPKAVWQNGSEEFRKGIIDGLFSSDGSIEQNDKKVKLISKYSKIISDVSELLGFYGIRTFITKTTRNNNFGKNKTYTSYVLTIQDNQSILHFKSLFKLSNPKKQEKLDGYKFNQTKQLGSSVVSVEKTNLLEPVWDISVYDETHCFNLGHCVTGNCCEIALRPMQFCNLTTVNVSDIISQDDLNQRVKAAAFIGTLQASYTDFHYLRQIWQDTTAKEALLGISQTGIASGKINKFSNIEATQIAIEENERVAKLININPAARLTCIKPEGTSSCVLGTSSGIHPWFSEFYVRRIRLGKNEPLYVYLKRALPQLVEDDYFKPHLQGILSLPIKSPDGAVTQAESAIELLERIKKFHLEWVKPTHIKGSNSHNVSATIHIRQHEWSRVGHWMWDNREHYNGLSILPYEDDLITYKQAPFERITKDTYEQLIQYTRNIDLLKVKELDDLTTHKQQVACAGGACEIQ